MTPTSTRLRFVSARVAGDLSLAISRLPFKVEIKAIENDGKRWVAWFILPEDTGIEFNNLEL